MVLKAGEASSDDSTGYTLWMSRVYRVTHFLLAQTELKLKSATVICFQVPNPLMIGCRHIFGSLGFLFFDNGVIYTIDPVAQYAIS